MNSYNLTAYVNIGILLVTILGYLMIPTNVPHEALLRALLWNLFSGINDLGNNVERSKCGKFQIYNVELFHFLPGLLPKPHFWS